MRKTTGSCSWDRKHDYWLTKSVRDMATIYTPLLAEESIWRLQCYLPRTESVLEENRSVSQTGLDPDDEWSRWPRIQENECPAVAR